MTDEKNTDSSEAVEGEVHRDPGGDNTSKEPEPKSRFIPKPSPGGADPVVKVLGPVAPKPGKSED